MSQNHDQFFSVCKTDLERLDAILRKSIPTHTMFVREPLQAHLVAFNEELGEFKKIEIKDVVLDKENPELLYLVEVYAASFPEFVGEFTGSPFELDIPECESDFQFIEGGQYNCVMRCSSDLIKKTIEALKKEKGLENHNVLSFYTEFFLSNKPAIKKRGSVLQIVFNFDVSYR